MTHHRKAGSTEAVLLSVIRRLPKTEIKRATDKEANSFRPCTNPVERGALSFDDAAKLDNLLKAHDLPALFSQRWEDLKRKRRPQRNTAFCIQTAVVEITAELGDVAAVARTALADGNLDIRERENLAAELQDVSDRALEARDAIQEEAGNVVELDPAS